VPVGFLMNVTPQISANDEIILNLRPTISRLTGFVEDPGVALSLALARQSGATLPDVSSRVPEIQTREMESILKLRDGQIAVLGGLMREECWDGEDAVPGASRLPVRAVYPCVGLVPNSGWTGLATDAQGAIVTDARLAASLPGVFAVGAVRAGHGGRLIDAVADGALAAKSVKEALQC
jgi:hypothetical protein